MKRKGPATAADQPITLSDSEMTTERTMTRRSLLGVLGLGTGVVAAAALGTMEPVAAADSDAPKKKPPAKKPPAKKAPAKKAAPKKETDND